MVIAKKKYNFPRFQRGSNIFQGGSNLFQGGGVQMLISMETDITCDLPKRVRTPYPTSGSAHDWIRIG